MRGGWTMVASPARPTYIYARGVSPLWLARVRRLLTEHSSDPGRTETMFDVRAWQQLEEWAAEPAQASATVDRSAVARAAFASASGRVLRRLRTSRAEAEGA
jgi:hypothetical protein